MKFFHGKIFAMYYQIALFDHEDLESYPQPETGDELVLFGEKGVTICTATDTDIEVLLTDELQNEPCMFLHGEGFIKVGGEGLLLGNVVSDDLNLVDLPPGLIHVMVYTNSSNPYQASKVSLILNRSTEFVPKK